MLDGHIEGNPFIIRFKTLMSTTTIYDNKKY